MNTKNRDGRLTKIATRIIDAAENADTAARKVIDLANDALDAYIKVSSIGYLVLENGNIKDAAKIVALAKAAYPLLTNLKRLRCLLPQKQMKYQHLQML